MVSRMPCHRWLASERSDHLPGLGCGVARNRTEHSISSGLPAAAFPSGDRLRRFRVFVAAYLIGYSGDVRRFPNGTAPIEASFGPRVRHRLNPRGKPPVEPRDPHRRGDDTARASVLPPETGRREEEEGSAAHVEATYQRPGLPPTPRRHHPLKRRSGRATRERLSHPAWPAQP